jgi:hypothetical protein
MKARDELKVKDTFTLSNGMDYPVVGTRCNIPELGGWVQWDGYKWNILDDYKPAENKTTAPKGG